MDVKRKLIKNTAINYIATFVDIGIGLVLLPFLLHSLGNELYGIYRLVLTLAGYLAIMQIGVGTTTVKYVAQHLANNEQKEIDELVTNSLVFYASIGVLMCLFLVLAGTQFVGYFNIPSEYLPTARQTLIISGFASLFLWPLTLFRKVLEGMQEYFLTSGYRIVFALIRLGLIFFFLHIGYGLVALIAIYFLTQIGQHLVYLAYTQKKLSFLSFSPKRLSTSVYKKIFSFSWVLFVIQVCGNLIYQTDRIVLGVFLPISALALYEGPWKIHCLVRRMNSIVGSAVIPATSSLNAREAKEKIEKLFLRGNKYASLIILPLAVSIIILAPYLVKYWLGTEYLKVTFAAQLFVSYWLLNCSFSLGGSILIAINKMKYILWYTVGGMIGNLVLSIILVNYLKNFVGVIWGTVIPYYIGYFIFLHFLLKLLKIRLGKFLRKVILPTYPYIAVCVLVGFVLLYLHLPANLFETGAYLVVMMASYWMVTYYVSFGEAEREDLRNLLGQ